MSGFGGGGSGFGGSSGGGGSGFGGGSGGGGSGFGGGGSGFGGSSGGGGSGFGGSGGGGGSGFGGGSGGGGSGFGGGGSGFGGSGGGGSFGGSGGGGSFGGSGGGGSFGGGGDRPQRGSGCFNCGEDGHRSADCPNPKKERSNACFNCGEEGHRSSDCPNPKKERSNACFNCGEEGHRSSECTAPRKERGGGGDGKCFNCGQMGHMSADCTEPRKERNENCFNCGQPGHMSADCTEPRAENKPASTHIPEDIDIKTLYAEHIEKGAMFEKFFDSKVEISAANGQKMDVVAIEEFKQLTLGDVMVKNIATAGYQKPTPIQKYAMPLIEQGKDIMACSQTGSGKTAAFLLPIMARLIKDSNLSNMGESKCSPRVLILAPTRELAIQIYKEAVKFSAGSVLRVEICYGGTSVAYQRSKFALGATIVVGTTGRMNHFIEEGTINLSEVLYLILDEADRMLDMGFSEDIAKITRHPSMRPKEERQTLMFSATFPNEVQTLAKEMLRPDYAMVVVDKIGAANKCIVQNFVKLERGEKKKKLLELLEVDLTKYQADKQSDVFKQKTLVFVSSKKCADMLGTVLNEAGLACTTIHGDREQRQREEALSHFRRGKTPVMIATAVAERGLDITGVDHVINYDMPKELDEYVHRIGRTGRVGNAGNATSFFVPDDDQGLVSPLVLLLAEAEQIVPDWLQEMQGCYGGGGGGGDFGAGGADDDWA